MDIIIVAAAAAVISALATWLIVRGHFRTRIQAQEQMHRSRVEDMEKMAQKAQDNYEKALKEMKETVVASMTAETEKLLKRREKELEEDNHSTMDGILKPLKESIDAMEKAMKDNAVSHVETNASFPSS